MKKNMKEKTSGHTSRSRLAAIYTALMLLGTMSVWADGRLLASNPTPDCGPTRPWNCVEPNCPSCALTPFVGTVCEKVAFEKATGLICSHP